MRNTFTILLIIILPLLTVCTPTNESNYDGPLIYAEASQNEFINALRLMDYSDFEIIEVVNSSEEDFKNKGSELVQQSSLSLIPLGWWTSTNQENSNPVFLGSERMIDSNHPFALESYMTLAQSRVAVGLGASTSIDDFKNAAVIGVQVFSDKSLGNDPDLFRENLKTLDGVYSLPLNRNEVMIGSGIQIEDGEIIKMWIYSTILNSDTGKLQYMEADDISVYMLTLSEKNQKHHLLSFDHGMSTVPLKNLNKPT